MILDAVWGTDLVAESNIVDRYIRSLRIKLQNGYRNPRFIRLVERRSRRAAQGAPLRLQAGMPVCSRCGTRPKALGLAT